MKRLAPLALIAACSSAPKLPISKLEDPATCKECHSQHYMQWSGSMHAYASDDPVFVAMNRRGQRDTNGQLGMFCVQCHAPMAVALGLTNGTDFDPTTLPPAARGVTCYFCHDIKSIKADHNNGLVLALDDTMRAGVSDPVDSPAHNSKYDPLMASATNDSKECGSCHDVVTPAGIPLERTYQEWQSSVFAHDDPMHHLPLTCSGCHMQTDPNTTVIADKPGLHVKSRPNSFHLHEWPGIDQALTTFPQQAAQTKAIHDILDPALQIIGPLPPGDPLPIDAPGGICVDPGNGGEITVRMVAVTPGHDYPSGAAQDRRAWLELTAYDASNNVLFQTGNVPDGMDPEAINDPNLVGFWDRTFKADGTPAHFFWDVASEQSKLLKVTVTLDPNSPKYDHSTTATFQVGATYSTIDHITARIRTRAFAYSVLDQLVQSGDLDPAIEAKMQTLDAQSSMTTWTKANADPTDGCCPAGDASC